MIELDDRPANCDHRHWQWDPGACIELSGQPTLSPLDPAMFEPGWRGPEGCVQLD